MSKRPANEGRVMGVDPGVKGAVATLDTVALTLEIDSMPVIRSQRKSGRSVTVIDAARLAEIVRRHDAGAVIVEEVGAKPTDGAVSAFSFGRTFGTILTTLTLCGLDPHLVTPAQWKRETKTPADKAEAIAWADRLFPNCKAMWRGPRGGLLHDRAEAAILALYGIASCGIPLQGSFRPRED